MVMSILVCMLNCDHIAIYSRTLSPAVVHGSYIRYAIDAAIKVIVDYCNQMLVIAINCTVSN